MGSRAWPWTGALLLVVPTAALADSVTDRAAALFRQGRAAMVREDFARACPKFAESARLDPAPGTLLNLALCQEEIGKLGSALTNYRLALALLPPRDDRVPFAREHAEALEPRVAHLKLLLSPGTPAGARVLHDGAEVALADLGAEDPVNPGAHEVTLRIPGRKDILFSVSLREGERRTLVLTLPAAPRPVVVKAEPTPAPAPFPKRTIGFIVGGVGATSLAAGLVTGGLVLDKKATVEASCRGTSECDSQEGVDAADAGSTLSTVSTITFIAGAAALGVGVFLVMTSETPGAVTAIGPAAVPGGGGLSVWRTF